MSLDQCVLVSMFPAFAAMGMHSVLMHAEDKRHLHQTSKS